MVDAILRANSPSLYLLSLELGRASSHKSEQANDKASLPLNKKTIDSAMNIVTNTDYSSIDASSSIQLLMELMREQQSIASKKVVSMLNFEDCQTKIMSLSLPAPISHIRADSSPSTSKSTGAIGNWLKKSKFHQKKHASLLMGGGLLRKASTTQQSRQRKAGFPLAATKKGASVKAHSMKTFRAQWSNGASRNQREVFARRLQRGTLVVVKKRN